MTRARDHLDRRAVTGPRAMRLAPAIALLAVLGGCDAFYTVRGTVRSCADQRAIPGATVALRYPGESGGGETTADGSYSVMVNDPPGVNDAELEVSSPGYATARRTVHHSYDESQDVCLEPAP